MGLLDSLPKDGSLIENLSQLASESPQVMQAAASLLAGRRGPSAVRAASAGC
jgi:hypothetical protein